MRPLLAAALVLPVAVPALAQFPLVEEISVTARDVSDDDLTVPVTNSIISLEELAELDIFDFEELADLTPGVNVSPGLQAGSIRIRGVGAGAFALNAPQSVAAMVDGFAQAQVGAVFTTLVDVQRVELLRGPQGTRYGQGAPVGAYNISTRAPLTDTQGGYVRGSYSLFDGDADLATADVRGAYNVPLVADKLGWRLAGAFRDAQGFVTVQNPAAGDDATGGTDAHALRSRMLWQASEQTQVNWTVNYRDVIDYPQSGNFEGQVPGTGGDNPEPARTTRFDEREFWGDFPSEVEARLRDTGLRISHDALWSQFELLASYQEYDTDGLQNRRPWFGTDSTLDLDLDYELTTFELRASGIGEWLDYSAGLFYFDRPSDAEVELTLGNGVLVADGQEGSETLSAFGNIDLHLSERYRLSLGLRYDDDDIDADYDAAIVDGTTGRLRDSNGFSHLSWSAKLSLLPADTFTLYLGVDSNYKRGGYNPLISIAADAPDAPPDVVEVARDSLRYDEETTTAIELGFKGAGLDNTLRYGLAFFYQTFDDYQISQAANRALLDPVGDVFTNFIANADDVITRGIDWNVVYQLNRRWGLSNRFSYFDADIERWNSRFCGGDDNAEPGQIYCPVIDEPLNNAPKWSANMQLRYQRPLKGWRLYSRLSWNWTSKVDDVRFTDEYREHKHRFNLAVGGLNPKYRLNLRLWVKNLTDEELNQNPGVQPNGDPTQPASFRGRYTRGREIGVTVGYIF